MPALEMTMRFAGARQKILAHNIANIHTPNFVARDVDPRSFQQVLGEAIDKRRAISRVGSQSKAPEIARGGEAGTLDLRPLGAHGGVLGHDRNAADLERLMQDMVENASAYRLATDLYRRQKGVLTTAISQRP
jgi:flagellar basal-body rod protein FlgB